jgi:outer membrane protein
VARRRRRLVFAAAAAAFFCTAPALALEELPLWELGFGFAAIDLPHYRGSDQSKAWLLPYPYVIYRGEVLKMEERRMRGLFFKSERSELDISANGTAPVKSSENQARDGMPDLDATLEIGPSLNVYLLQSADTKTKLDLRLPVRAVIATNLSHFNHAGWVFGPNLSVDVHDVFGNDGMRFGAQAGVLYGDRRYHEYFYSVAPEFATPTRAAFAAPGGYSGAVFLASLSKRYAKSWVGGYIRIDSVRGAAFESSPLVKTKENYTAGIAMAWVFRESATLVMTRE